MNLIEYASKHFKIFRFSRVPATELIFNAFEAIRRALPGDMLCITGLPVNSSTHLIRLLDHNWRPTIPQLSANTRGAIDLFAASFLEYGRFSPNHFYLNILHASGHPEFRKLSLAPQSLPDFPRSLYRIPDEQLREKAIDALLERQTRVLLVKHPGHIAKLDRTPDRGRQAFEYLADMARSVGLVVVFVGGIPLHEILATGSNRWNPRYAPFSLSNYPKNYIEASKTIH